MIVGIDPGPQETAIVVIDRFYEIVQTAKLPSEDAVRKLESMICITSHIHQNEAVHVAIESVKSFGMPVGREVFETCYWIGEFRRICKTHEAEYALYARQTYGNAICGCSVDDSKLRQALALRFGGYKKSEPLFQVAKGSDLRSAFAVAVYHMDLLRMGWMK